MSAALKATNTTLSCVEWANAPQRVCAAVTFAERQALRWGVWQKGEYLFFVLGGELEAYQPTQVLPSVLEELSHNFEDPNTAVMLTSLPKRLVSRRFTTDAQSLAAQTSTIDHQADEWAEWGEHGFIWSPALSLCFNLETSIGLVGQFSPIKESAYLNKLFTTDNHTDDLIADQRQREMTLDRLQSMESYSSWQRRVEEVKRRCHLGEVSKVVFARSWTKRAPKGYVWSGALMWQKCLEKAMKNEIPFALSPTGIQCFVGVSPERLFETRGQQLSTHALAGTKAIKHGSDDRDLERISKELIASTKDAEEHQIVVSLIKEALSETCSEITIGDRHLKRAGSLLHLETSIEAIVHPGVSAQMIMECLHPTPALGGAPKAEALSLIKEMEPMQRGAYAAPWLWETIGGEACAVVGIRSALLSSNEARVYAGAGIVGRSDAEAEWLETLSKAEVMDSLLGHDVLIDSNPTSAQKEVPSIELRQQRRCLYLVEAMKQAGLAGAVLSPGSRNTPLALALDKLLPCLVSVDERSAGFTALGWAKSSDQPIALCCTSGSAAAHYLPALIEAKYSAVSLIVLSADRPLRLRGKGAPQTIDQRHLFIDYSKHSIELCSDHEEIDLEASNSLDQKWYSTAVSALKDSLQVPRGTVHLNLPFEEPLWSEESEALLETWGVEWTQQGVLTNSLLSSTTPISLNNTNPYQGCDDEFLSQLNQIRGVIYCGPLSPPAAEQLSTPLAKISALTGWPIFAEGSSQLCGLIPTINDLDQLIRGKRAIKGSQLQVVLTVGAHTHSRAVRVWLEDSRLAAHFWLGEGPETVDPLNLGVKRLGRSLSHAVHYLEKATKTLLRMGIDRSIGYSSWTAQWHELTVLREMTYRHSEFHQTHTHPEALLWGGAIGELLCHKLDQARTEGNHQHRADLVIASSMAFRDHDMMWTPHCPLPTDAEEVSSSLLKKPAYCWVNRGANGIDGTFSTALGIALGRERSQTIEPLVVWIGDLAAHHDLQGLHRLSRWAGENGSRPVIILLTNNEGGGIFHLLPIKGANRFKPLFQTPLSVTNDNEKSYRARQSIESPWAHLAKWCEADSYQCVLRRGELSLALDTSLIKAGLHLIEVIYDPVYDQRLHQEYWCHQSMTHQEEADNEN